MKKYDIVATTGEYTNQQGEQKKRFLNVGAVIDTGNGPFIVMEKWFNPGALAEQGRDSVILSLYEPKNKQQAPSGTGGGQYSASQQAQTPPSNQSQTPPNFDDDIGF